MPDTSIGSMQVVRDGNTACTSAYLHMLRRAYAVSLDLLSYEECVQDAASEKR